MKPAYQSKTLWTNLILAISAFIPQLQAHVTPETIAIVFTVANTILRFLTTEKVTIG